MYGPQEDQEKIDFLADLLDMSLIGGDFNMIASAADKNTPNLNHRVMNRFRRFIADEELRDIYLHGRRYTWS